MLYFKVKTGYGADDFLSITEDELPTALRAQIGGKVAVFAEGTIGGNHIMSITPDYNRVLGFARSYRLTPEDYEILGNTKRRQHEMALDLAAGKARNELGLGARGAGSVAELPHGPILGKDNTTS